MPRRVGFCGVVFPNGREKRVSGYAYAHDLSVAHTPFFSSRGGRLCLACLLRNHHLAAFLSSFLISELQRQSNLLYDQKTIHGRVSLLAGPSRNGVELAKPPYPPPPPRLHLSATPFLPCSCLARADLPLHVRLMTWVRRTQEAKQQQQQQQQQRHGLALASRSTLHTRENPTLVS